MEKTKTTIVGLHERLKSDGIDIDYNSVSILYRWICNKGRRMYGHRARVAYDEYIKLRDLLK